jgi:hypothetical protein
MRMGRAHQSLDTDSIAGEKTDLADHLRASCHDRIDDQLSQHEPHLRCSHVHSFLDDCPVPYDSPAGLVIRATRATLGKPTAAAHRLIAASALSEWVADQRLQGVVGARISGLDWTEIAQSAGVSEDNAINRWGNLIARLEAASLIDPTPKSY